MTMTDQTTGAAVGTKWQQFAIDADGKLVQTRVIEITSKATPSMAIGYVIRKNVAHPHRVGRTGRIRRADLETKYVQVAA